jgi:signal transduction histidine kinase
MPLRWKLTLWYVASVTLILAAFVGADVYGRASRAEAAPTTHVEDVREELWEHSWLALLTIIGVGLVGHFAIGRALRPVREMAALAKTITAEDLSRRIRTSSRDELGELGETLNEMIARLERSFLHMGQFATVVAHELNTPLATLKGELELVRRRERTSEEYRTMIPRLQAQVERLSALVDNLLLLSRMESQKTAFQLNPLQLDEVVLETYEEFEEPAKAAGLGLSVEVPERAMVNGEKALLKQMIGNLVANAVRYTDAGGSVTVRVIVTETGARLHVIDTGRGIAPEALPHVFEPFYRSSAASSSSQAGVGLGLAIVRRVADLHGCELQLQSEIGKGTTVTVTWPPAAPSSP